MPERPPDIRSQFDRAFFERFYQRSSTAVISADDVYRRARFVLAYLAHLQLEVHSVLDAGCGTGLWKKALRRVDRDIAYTGIDPSEYLCRRYGWTQTAIADFAPRRTFDLVVCQDVLQYVDDTGVRRSIAAMKRACAGALYFDVPTTDDIDDGLLDMKLTDRAIHVRGAEWYRRLLRKSFVNAGGGVFLKKNASAVILALERLG
ncbi:MAG: class I SAM-dependent methyltransferase [Candidatus Krumholzibacteria bacterium]|nr:class I SAM-dependent methyltransferase [Candidatus Krumholzibacteria bacterium]MDH4335760.1 class I SAM-dependent methyltransferase [Candidatus Krumholzibacteria bacterium]MDH5269286.1 class I SAM-dependent methyltransferase [Candidatus Krumholzibacteria bacterium]